MSSAGHNANHDEKTRGLRPWDAVRQSKVERARQLIQDPDYPSKKTLDAVADVLARSLASKRRSPPDAPK